MYGSPGVPDPAIWASICVRFDGAVGKVLSCGSLGVSVVVIVRLVVKLGVFVGDVVTSRVMVVGVPAVIVALTLSHRIMVSDLAPTTPWSAVQVWRSLSPLIRVIRGLWTLSAVFSWFASGTCTVLFSLSANAVAFELSHSMALSEVLHRCVAELASNGSKL